MVDRGLSPAHERLRRDARACCEAALAAVEPGALVADWLRAHELELEAGGRLVVAAVGKAGATMAQGAVDVLGARIDGGMALVPASAVSAVPAPLEAFAGGHPLPSADGVEGAARLLETARGLGERDVLLVLVSGGGSALATLPPEGASLGDLQTTTRSLLRAGATIDELNCVRKHLDRLKGGRLARAAAPARVVALVLSDVVGDPLDVIASGPVTGDPTTFADARVVLERRGVWEDLPPAVRAHLEAGERGERADSPTPGDPLFERVSATIIGSNRSAADAALELAAARGYAPLLLTTLLEGEAREAGRLLASIGREVQRSTHPIAAPACLLAAGETTVTVRGDGRGGRNQELALGAALALEAAAGPMLVVGFGTDGVDGPTDAAGAWADERSCIRARAAGLDPLDHLRRNDAYTLFAGLDDLLVTGPTGTNVMDLAIVLVAPAGDPAEQRRE
ncbi:MAG: DUF4147 domain-containing protein [Acidobacteriota bacterium]